MSLFLIVEGNVLSRYRCLLSVDLLVQSKFAVVQLWLICYRVLKYNQVQIFFHHQKNVNDISFHFLSSKQSHMYQEMEQRDGQLNLFQEQNQRLQELNNELQEQLHILPSIEEMLELLEQKDGEIQTLKEENRMMKAEDYQWKELAEKLNDENRLLQRQNEKLLNCRTD